jgi:uncharacterized protein YjbI with pentapeptide repeats
MTLDAVDFSDADLGGADFRACVMDRCRLRGASLRLARFQGADLRSCDLGPLNWQEAGIFKGAVISRDQADELLRGLGLTVM